MALTNYGYTTVTSVSSRSANNEHVVRVVTAATITIDGLMLSFSSSSASYSSTAKLKALIYNADATPDPTTLVATGTEVVGTAKPLLFLPFASSQTLTAGTYFWGFHTDTALNVDTVAASGQDVRRLSRSYASGPLDPFGTPSGSDALGITIFAVSGTGLEVAKAYELTLLALPAGVSVAKAYDLLLLQDGSAAPPEPRPQGMIIT